MLVPSAAAAEQLRRTIEGRLLTEKQAAIVLPHMGNRAALYQLLASRLPRTPRLLSSFEREVMLSAAARAAEARGVAPPFRLRPGLVAEMLDLYDHIRRQGRSIADFERNFRGELEAATAYDRGAEKLLQQTVFLNAVFEGYETRLRQPSSAEPGSASDEGLVDEHVLRGRLMAEPPTRPMTAVIVAVGDRQSDADGLWPADFDLLARLPGLERLDIVATEGQLTAGLLGRLHAAFPGIEDEPSGEPGPPPRLIVPTSGAGGGARIAFVSRDREEELIAIARRVKADRRGAGAPPLDRTALVVHRPLPYLYLARDVFAGAGVPFETLDTLPLAAEPYAAAVDLVLESVMSDFSRHATDALLRSPHFRFEDLGTTEGVPSTDDGLSTEPMEGTTLVVPGLIERLAPLAQSRPMVDQIECLLTFLHAFDRPAAPGDPDPTRRERVRGAVVDALTALSAAYRAHDPTAQADVATLSAAIRRWLGARTFAVRAGTSGLQIVDVQAARFGTFDDVQLVGLIDGEWPERPRRPVFYPASLMNLLEPVSADPDRRERDAVHASRAAFIDLLHLARGVLRVSTVLLENDAVVEPSMLLDEIPAAGLVMSPQPIVPPARIFQHEAMTMAPHALDALPDATAVWARVRTADRDDTLARFRGSVGRWQPPRISVSRLERYLDCPFRFFSSEVLTLEEEIDEQEDTRTPLERGRFLHELFEAFFAEWQRRGHRRIDAAHMDEARATFTEVCERKLAVLSPAEAALERVRLQGSAVSPGIAHRVFEMEAERHEVILERLLEYPFEGTFTFHRENGESRTIALRGKADRIDLLENGRIRVIDYKSKKTPDPKAALQLPVYSLCARERLRGYRGRAWTIGEAAYLSFEGERAVVPLKQRDLSLEQIISGAEGRLLSTLDAIEAGEFPPRPSKRSLCTTCAFSTVCRKEWVEADADE